MTELNLEQQEKEDSSDGDLIGSEVKEFKYEGRNKEKKIKLKQLKIANSLEES